ncbi:MAG: DUF1622 domain-containing protein [Gammaproteobacteria bacterium]
MEHLLREAAHYVALIVQAAALLVIAIGALEAIVGVFRVMLSRAGGFEQRAVWLRFAHWLVAGLTFQLAADIVETTVAPTWDEIGRVAAIALIRTFLTYFLDRDVERIREAQHPRPEGSARGEGA